LGGNEMVRCIMIVVSGDGKATPMMMVENSIDEVLLTAYTNIHGECPVIKEEYFATLLDSCRSSDEMIAVYEGVTKNKIALLAEISEYTTYKIDLELLEEELK
jgi:hypothetical protein